MCPKQKSIITIVFAGEETMANKFVVLFSFVLMTVASVYAASPEQPKSASLDQNSLNLLIDKANKGDPNAQYDLGWHYCDGNGVGQDYKKAIEWYTKAAEQENVDAQFELGRMYLYGCGVPKDYKEAAKWFTKAGEQGDADAQLKLGLMYEDSIFHMPQDYNEAVKWYRKSAEQGNVNAQCALGMMYREGQGVSQDYQEAVKWYRKSAEQGYAGAQNGLGRMYENGKGVPEDYVQAYKWYILAEAQGRREYEEYRDLLKQRMTPEQIAEAQRLAREFKPQKQK